MCSFCCESLKFIPSTLVLPALLQFQSEILGTRCINAVVSRAVKCCEAKTCLHISITSVSAAEKPVQKKVVVPGNFTSKTAKSSVSGDMSNSYVPTCLSLLSLIPHRASLKPNKMRTIGMHKARSLAKSARKKNELRPC